MSNLAARDARFSVPLSASADSLARRRRTEVRRSTLKRAPRGGLESYPT
jgi:hypothetical protein